MTGKNGDREAAAVRANNAMPRQAGVYYYEVEIISKGQLGCVFPRGILAARSVSISHQRAPTDTSV
jgi:hypothetical protein